MKVCTGLGSLGVAGQWGGKRGGFRWGKIAKRGGGEEGRTRREVRNLIIKKKKNVGVHCSVRISSLSRRDPVQVKMTSECQVKKVTYEHLS